MSRAMEHEEMISEIKKFIEEKKDFFIGGRGIGIEVEAVESVSG